MDPLRSALPAVLLVAALHGCSGGDEDVPAVAPSTSMPGSASSPTIRSTAPSGDHPLGDKVDQAREILSRDGGHAPDAITVVSAESVKWPNSAYGCPSHESSYAPGPFAGYRIVLEANGQDYVYTGADDTDPRRCLFLD